MKEGTLVRYDGELWEIESLKAFTAKLHRVNGFGHEVSVVVEKRGLKKAEEELQEEFVFNCPKDLDRDLLSTLIHPKSLN